MSVKKAIYKMIDKTKYAYLNTFGWLLYKAKHSDEASILLRNKEFEGKYKGMRCFVLGNGPSLKDVDFSDLKDEYVFTVNQIARKPEFRELNTNFHFWVDANFFNLDSTKPEDMELLEVMKEVKTKENSPKCFYPIEYKSFVEKFQLHRLLDVYYFKTPMPFYEGFNHRIDMSRFGMSFGTVVQWAIQMAVYMGFTEIYLLGCDNTGILTLFKTALKSNDDSDYVYKFSDNDKKRMESLLFSENSLEGYVEAYLQVMIGYRRLSAYCRANNVKLINCSSQTVIDSIERMQLKDVLKSQ